MSAAGRRTGTAAAAGLLGLAVALSGCGSRPAPGAGQPAAGITEPALATSMVAPGGASWAVVLMGASAAQHNNFWELFVRPAGGTAWKLATPVGVASNGGILAAAAGSGSVMVAVRPSQDLTFTPLAQTADAGSAWSQDNVFDSGIADSAGALAGSPSGKLLALTESGVIDTGSGAGASWHRLTTQGALAGTGAGRACGLTRVTTVDWTPSGAPLLGGDCRKAGVAGIFTLTGGGWRSAGLRLTGALATDPASVVGLTTAGSRMTALLAVGTGAATGVVAAWSADDGTSWTLSAELPAGLAATSTGTASRQPSVSFGPDGSAAVAFGGKHVGSANRGAVIGWQAAAWQRLPVLPADTVTIAATPSGTPEALTAHLGTLKAWQLSTTSGGAHWQLLQTVGVSVPYGSSS
jgi:hypothetical protein